MLSIVSRFVHKRFQKWRGPHIQTTWEAKKKRRQAVMQERSFESELYLSKILTSHMLFIETDNYINKSAHRPPFFRIWRLVLSCGDTSSPNCVYTVTFSIVALNELI